MREANRDGTLNKFKVSELKEFLVSKDIPASGVKNFLITLVKEFFDN
jgi:hypothetical protein